MSTRSEEKLKKTLEAIPAGFLVDSRWLSAHGISRFLAQKYLKSGWLNRVTRGVFRRPTPEARRADTLDWQTCLLSVQHIMEYHVHVGGMTALGLQGFGHYLPLGGKSDVWLYGSDTPNWLSKIPLDAHLHTRPRALFAEPERGLTQPGDDDTKGRSGTPWGWELVMASPERAVLEALDELPDHESFDNLDMVFEGLTTLRPRTLSALLTACKKIKVKRLFFVFADRHNHAWRKRLDADDFDLGSGDRALVKGGKIHSRYRIVVPPEFAAGKESSDGS